MYGLKSDLNSIINIFKYSSVDSAVKGTWRTFSLQGKQSQLNTAYSISSSPKKIPDVTGLGLKDAVYLLENMGLKVIASGRGKVVHQSLLQDSGFVKGQSINIQLN